MFNHGRESVIFWVIFSYLKSINRFYTCVFQFIYSLKDSLLVLMSYEKNDLSLDITLKHFAQFYGGDDENIDCDLETSDVIENIQTANNGIIFKWINYSKVYIFIIITIN